MLVPIVVVVAAIFKIGIKVPHLFFCIGKVTSSSRIDVFVLPDKEDEGANPSAQRANAAKQQFKYVEQASASSGNPSLLVHRPALVSSYSLLIIARTTVGRWPSISHGFSVLAKNNAVPPSVFLQPLLSGNDLKQALGPRTSTGSVKALDESAHESPYSINGRDRCIRQH